MQSQLRGRWRDTEWKERKRERKNGPKKEGRQNCKLSGHHSRRTWFVTLNKTQRQDSVYEWRAEVYHCNGAQPGDLLIVPVQGIVAGVAR